MPTIAREVTRQRAGTDILIQIVARVANLALGAVVTALIVRALGKDHYGQWSTTFAVLGLIGYLSTFGLEEVAVREASREPEEEFAWLGSVIMARLIALGPIMLFALGAVVVLHQSTEMLVAGLILVLAMPFGGVSAIGILFRLRVDNRIPMIVLTLRSVLWGIAVVVIYVEGGGMVPLAISMIATNLLATSVQLLAARRMVGSWPRPTRKHLAPLVRTAVPVGFSSLLIIAYGRIDQVIVFTIKGAKEAGLYGSIYMLLDSASFVPASIMTTMAPVIAAAWPQDEPRMRKAVRLTIEMLCVGSFGALAFAAVASRPVVHLIFGQEFVEAAGILPVLGGAFVLICFGYVNDNLLLVLGKQRLRVTIGLVALVVNLIGNFALVPSFGYEAAAWVTLATEGVVVVMEARIVFAALGLRRPQLGRVWRCAACALLLAGELLVARALRAPLGASVALAAVSYPTLLLGLGGVAIEDVLVLLKRRAPAA